LAAAGREKQGISFESLTAAQADKLQRAIIGTFQPRNLLGVNLDSVSLKSRFDLG
jgi:hypothetical protein